MSRARSIMMILVAALSVGAMVVSSASAAINFEWKVGGTSLKEGESREFHASNSVPWNLHGTIAGATTLILFHRITYDGSHVYRSFIIDLWLLEFPLVHRPANCSIAGGTVGTTPLKGEIVEGAVGKAGNGEVDIVFAPTTGETFATFEFAGSSCLVKGSVASLTGLVLALASPQKTEVLKNDLSFEANTKEYRNSKNEFKTAGLVFAGNAATLTGLSLILLVSDQVFGAF